MWSVLRERWRQGHRTAAYPRELPVLPDRYRGRPELDAAKCPEGCRECVAACPTDAITRDGPHPLALDLGRCLFCTDCVEACPTSCLEMAGALPWLPRPRDCVSCAVCVVLCPVEALRMASGDGE